MALIHHGSTFASGSSQDPSDLETKHKAVNIGSPLDERNIMWLVCLTEQRSSLDWRRIFGNDRHPS